MKRSALELKQEFRNMHPKIYTKNERKISFKYKRKGKYCSNIRKIKTKRRQENHPLAAH